MGLRETRLAPRLTEVEMSSTLLPLLLFYYLSVFFLATIALSDSSSNSFIYGGCSQLKCTPTVNSPHQANLASVLSSLSSASLYSLYANATAGSKDSDTVSGVVQCRGDVTPAECGQCVQDAVSQLRLLCPEACGAAIQLDACFLKYDAAPFLGAIDITLILKRCGSSSGYYSGMADHREEVFRQLTSGGEPSFRRGSSSGVDGLAQCVGDLSDGDCTLCVSAAVGRLQADCGSSVSGEAFLGKCYARFSQGSLPTSPPASGGGYTRPNIGTYHEDEAGKTLAIIIGLFAGVALLILFLSFIRRSYNNGKG